MLRNKAFIHNIGKKHNDGGKCTCSYRNGHLFGAHHRCFLRILHRALVPVNILCYNNGIINQHTDRQHEPHHRENIQADVEEKEKAQGNNQRKRHGSGYDQSCTGMAQEDVEHENREQCANHAGIEEFPK